MSKEPSFPCPCCGYLTYDEEPEGHYEICEVCFWEDDPIQLKDHDFEGGANTPSLNQAKENFKQFGACEERFVKNTRDPWPEENPK